MPQHVHPRLSLRFPVPFDAAAPTANDDIELQAERRLIVRIFTVVCTVSFLAVLAGG